MNVNDICVYKLVKFYKLMLLFWGEGGNSGIEQRTKSSNREIKTTLKTFFLTAGSIRAAILSKKLASLPVSEEAL